MRKKHLPAKLLAGIPFLILCNNGCNSLDDNQKQTATENSQAQVQATNDDLNKRTDQLIQASQPDLDSLEETILETLVLQRSLEIAQIDELIKIAQNQKKGTFFQG